MVMTNWNCFMNGMGATIWLLFLICLVFGGVTIWPMKRPIKEHRVLYLAVIVFAVLMIGEFVWSTWR